MRTLSCNRKSSRRHVPDHRPPAPQVDGRRAGPRPVAPQRRRAGISPVEQVDDRRLARARRRPGSAVIPTAGTSIEAPVSTDRARVADADGVQTETPARASAPGFPDELSRSAWACWVRSTSDTQRALLGDHQLVLALGLVQVVEGLEAEEEQHEGALDRDLRVGHPGHQPDQQQRADDRLLERHHGLLGEDALAQGLVQAARVLLEDGGHQPLAVHRLEQLHALEHVGQAREQRAQRAGLLASGAPGDAHQEAEHAAASAARPGRRRRSPATTPRAPARCRATSAPRRTRSARGGGRRARPGPPRWTSRSPPRPPAAACSRPSATRAARAAGSGADRWRPRRPCSPPGASRAGPARP